MLSNLIRDLRRRRWELQSFKRPKVLVWRVPGPQKTVSDDHIALSYVIPTVSPRKIRFLGRREVYPHSMHVHIAPIHRIEEP